MPTDLKSGAATPGAIDQAGGQAHAATPLGAFAPARATAPPPPGNRPPAFPWPFPSHTLSDLGEGPDGTGGREVGNPNGVGGEVWLDGRLLIVVDRRVVAALSEVTS